MEILRNGSQPSRQGPASYFTGSVRMDMEFSRDAPARIGGVTVTFEPGARTHWHTHPLGQTVIVTAGVGWACLDGEARQEIRAGDIVWFPPGIRHWHGASDKTGMTHIAIAESLDGSRVDWEEPVSDAEYLSF
ncbi:MAG: cupin domain-containing protein [Pseudomonadota bacterium]